MAIGFGEACPKPIPRCVDRKIRQKLDAKDEREARQIVRDRDRGICRVPGCRSRADHVHHIIYRSQSKRRRWDPQNLVSLCVDHHRLEHAGVITIRGNANKHLEITGDVNALRFRLR